MSADNWAICHICEKKIMDKYEKDVEKAKASYGKVTPEEYQKNIQIMNKQPQPNKTFREDYEIGICNGIFYVNYRGYCSECGFEFNYKIEKEMG